ncbi:MAG: hypothetical protein JSV22_06835 [Bacteroidales bacterium]|nr:MAG: hypothetical protein JSV22_06835 [Bacteroidales bacterium]
MKRIIILVMVAAINLTVKAQYSREKEHYSHYGMNISKIYSGSGHGYGITINTNIQKARKSLEVGAIYQTSEDKIAGADIRYKIFFGRFNDFLNGDKLFNPFLQYNLIYRKATVDAPVIVIKNKAAIELSAPTPAVISTIEHYVSLGIQLKIYNRFYFDSSFGLGLYIGYIDKINKPAAIGIHRDNHGFTTSYKLGIGYRFN